MARLPPGHERARGRRSWCSRSGRRPGCTHGIYSDLQARRAKFGAAQRADRGRVRHRPAQGNGLTDPRVAIDGAGARDRDLPRAPRGLRNTNPLVNSRSTPPRPGLREPVPPGSEAASGTSSWSTRRGNDASPGPDYNETDGTIASNEAGNRVAGLTSQRYEDDGTRNRQTVHATQRAPGADRWTDGGPADLTAIPDRPADAVTTAASSDRFMIAWREAVDLYAAHEGAPQIVSDNGDAGPRAFVRPGRLGQCAGAVRARSGGLEGVFSAKGGAATFEQGRQSRARQQPRETDPARCAPVDRAQRRRRRGLRGGVRAGASACRNARTRRATNCGSSGRRFARRARRPSSTPRHHLEAGRTGVRQRREDRGPDRGSP